MASSHRGERQRVRRSVVWDKSDVTPDTAHIRDIKEKERQILSILDNIGFNWVVFVAVSSGFLASSYTIFSSNIIGPALQYVYPPKEHGMNTPVFTIDMVTISTTTIGMLVFGHLADRLGRKRLYGIELFIIILGTVGMIQSSDGYARSDGDHSLNVYAAIASWRGLQGLGIGAEYPLSALIAAEFASTQTRGTLMAAMFAMQSVGRVLAYIVVIGAISGIDGNDSDHRIEIDKTWRLVVGISAIPALLAIGLRLTIPETPRYYAGIEKNISKAVKAVKRVGGKDDDLQSVHSDILPTRGRRYETATPWFSSAWSYLVGEKQGWKPLVGISLLWFMLDIAFYGLGLDSPATLHRLWLSEKPADQASCTRAPEPMVTTAVWTLANSMTTTVTQLIPAPTTTAIQVDSDLIPWNQDENDLCATIEKSLKTTAHRTLLLTSIASMVGSLVAIGAVNYVTRKRLMAVTSGILFLLFLAAGVSVLKATETEHHEVSMVFFALSQFMFNMGPNTLTFILAAESFPTVYRGTFCGFAAASGKLGALAIRPVMHAIGDDKQALVGVMFGFSGVMLLMAGISLIPGWISEVQYPRRKAPKDKQWSLATVEAGWRRYIPKPLVNKTLEDIAPNPDGNRNGLVNPYSVENAEEGMITGKVCVGESHTEDHVQRHSLDITTQSLGR